MNGTFQNMALKGVKGLFSQTRVGVSSTSSALLTAVNKIKVYLEDSVSKAENFLPAFLSNPDLTSDDSVTNMIMPDSAIVRVDSDTADLIFNAIEETGEDGQIVLSDGDGRPYFLRAIRDQNNQKLMVATSLLATYDQTVSGMLDCTVEHLNLSTGPSVIDKVWSLCNSRGLPHPTILDGIRNLARYLGERASPAYSIDENSTVYYYAQVCAYLACGEYPVVNPEPILWQENGSWFFQNVWPTTGAMRSFYVDVLSSLVENDAVNTCLLKFCRLTTAGQASVGTVVAGVAEMATSKFSSVREICSNMVSAVSSGGLSGLAQAIISYFKSVTSIVDDDGKFEFTDNSSFVPTVYVAGIVSAVISAVSTIATIIATIIGRALGIVVAVISMLGQQIYQAISKDSSATRCSVIDTEATQLDMAPLAIVQGEVDAANYPTIVGMLKGGYPVVALQILGGWVLYGVGDVSSSGDIQKLRFEVHPDTDGHYGAWYWFIETKVRGSISYRGAASVLQRAELVGSLSIDPITATDIEDAIEYDQRFIDGALVNQADGYLSEHDDTVMALRVCRSTALCLLSLQFMAGNPTGDAAILGPSVNTAIAPDFFVSESEDVMDDPRTLGWLAWMLPRYYATHGDHPDEHRYYWTWLAKCVNNTSQAWLHPTTAHAFWPTSVSTMLNQGSYSQVPVLLNGKIQFSLSTPKYSAGSFWSVVAITAILSTVAVVGTIALATGIKRAIRRKQAIAASKVYAAADEFQHHPDDAHYQAYRKAVTKNNVFATLTGGTKYDRVNVWNAGSAATSGNVASSLITSPYIKDNFLEKETPAPVIPEYPDPEQAVAAGIYQLNESMTQKFNALSEALILLSKENTTLDELSRERLNRIAVLISGRPLF